MMPIPMKAAAGAGHVVRSKAATDSDEAGWHGRLAAAVARVAGRCGLVKGVAARARSPTEGPYARRRVPFTVAHGRRARGSAVDPRGRASCGSAPALAQGDALELGALGVVHNAIEKGGGEPVTN
jgi:hypothetical protein